MVISQDGNVYKISIKQLHRLKS